MHCMIEEKNLRNIKQSMYMLLRDCMCMYGVADSGYDEKPINIALEFYNAALAEYCKLYLDTFKGKTMKEIRELTEVK